MRTLAVLTLLSALVLLAVPAAAQQATPVPDEPPRVAPANQPPIITVKIHPRRVVYLDSEPSAGTTAFMEAQGSVDPEGLPLEYSFDVDGDGTFTPFFINSAGSEVITMAGPFVATARLRDPLGAVAAQSIPMEARQFTHSAVDYNSGPPAAAIIAGRPALAFRDPSGIEFSLSDHSDGRGPWSRSRVNPAGEASMYSFGSIIAACSLAAFGSRPLIACGYDKDGQPALQLFIREQPTGGDKWNMRELVRLRGPSAPIVTLSGMGQTIVYFSDDSLVLLGSELDPSDVLIGGFSLMWSVTVGDVPPTAHSGVITTANGLPALAYLDATRAQLAYAVNAQANGRGKWDIVTVDGQMIDIGTPSLALVGGKPAIAYRDGLTGRLKYAAAANADGRGAWKVSVIDPSTGKAGPRTQSLAVIDGRPAIAYEHETRGLVFAYYPGWESGNYWPTAVVDARVLQPDLSGGFPYGPILLAVAGRPYIVYTGANGLEVATVY